MTLVHESFEMAMTRLSCRYGGAPDYGQCHGAYLFVMTHSQFAEAAAISGGLLAACLPDLGRAYARWKKPRGRH